jgi:hypothetical protein
MSEVDIPGILGEAPGRNVNGVLNLPALAYLCSTRTRWMVSVPQNIRARACTGM